MSRYKFEYDMTWRKLSLITQKRDLPIDGLICRICQKPIEAGQKVISKQRRNGKRICHKKCFMNTFVA